MDVKYELTTSDKRYYDPALHRNYSKDIEDVIHVDLSSATFCYIAGDINIDFYKYHSDKFTSEYLDMLFDLLSYQ